MKITVLLLAAGNSSRMGYPKQLLTWGGGTLIEHAADIALSSEAGRLIAVLGAKEKEVRSALGDRKIEIAVNTQWKEGLGSSIRTGMEFMLSGEQLPDAVLIMLADQPFIDPAYLNKLIAHFISGDGEIICTDYGRKKGTPAIFHRKYFSALAHLRGEKGAGHLIAAHPTSVFSLAGGRRTADLDTPEDLIRLKKSPSNIDL